jgi:hypothetical protein
VSRMGHLGEGAKEAAARRKVWSAQEERSRKEGEAFYSAYIWGRGWPGQAPGQDRTLGSSSMVLTVEEQDGFSGGEEQEPGAYYCKIIVLQ